jgi:hypothetical protein
MGASSELAEISPPYGQNLGTKLFNTSGGSLVRPRLNNLAPDISNHYYHNELFSSFLLGTSIFDTKPSRCINFDYLPHQHDKKNL